MHPILDDLISLLKLERIEENIFRVETVEILVVLKFLEVRLSHKHFLQRKAPLKRVALLIRCMPIF